jgi:hypothetical protein
MTESKKHGGGLIRDKAHSKTRHVLRSCPAAFPALDHLSSHHQIARYWLGLAMGSFKRRAMGYPWGTHVVP